MGIQRVRQWQRLEPTDDLKSWSEKHLKDHGAESSLRIQDFDHNRLTNLHPSMLVTASPTFVGLTLSGLTASKPVFTSAAKALVSTGTLAVDQGGTNLTSLGAANTVLGVNAAAGALEYKAITAGTGISVTPTAGVLTLANSGVLSIVAGTNITISGGTGNVTVTAVEETGSIKLWGAAATPTNWLLCDGTSYLRATYAALFAVIGVTFGSADGTHFNVPDFRDFIPMGKGAADTLGATGGAATHKHSVDPPSTATSQTTADKPIGSGANDATAGYHTHTVDIAAFDSAAASSLPPIMYINFIIRT